MKSLRELEGRVSLIEPDVCLFRGLEMPTPDTVTFMVDRLEELTARRDKFYLIHLFALASRPDPAVREVVLNRFGALKHRLVHVALVTHGSIFHQMTAVYIGRKMGFKSYSTHRKLEKAIAKIEAVKKRAS